LGAAIYFITKKATSQCDGQIGCRQGFDLVGSGSKSFAINPEPGSSGSFVSLQKGIEHVNPCIIYSDRLIDCVIPGEY
jgi:hypothetical protein